MIVNFLGALVDLKTIIGLGGGLTALSNMGALPKVGAGRALTLYMRSKFTPASPFSVRLKEISSLRSRLASLRRGHYLVVTGGKGLGKSCLIDSVLSQYGGVIKISVESGETESSITDKVMQEITNIRLRWFNLSANTKRVLWFYNLFGASPIVVIRVSERQKEQPYADVTSAVRGLADDFGLRVLVDGSQNSIPPEIKATGRQSNVYVMPMERELINKIPEFSEITQFLTKHSLEEGVWRVLGGSPQRYNMLAQIISMHMAANDATDTIVMEVKNHVHSLLLDSLNQNIAKTSQNTDKILKILQTKNTCQISISELKAQGLSVDYPNKVFREIEKGMHRFVEPASPAVGLIIQENIASDDQVAEFVDKLFPKAKV